MIRLAIVEDNLIYRDALELYLRKVTNIKLVNTSSNLQTMPVLIASRPDVVIMDVNLGADSGIEGIPLIKKALPNTSIFILTVFDDEEKMVQSIQAGASGYLLKKDSPKKILEVICDNYTQSLKNGSNPQIDVIH